MKALRLILPAATLVAAMFATLGVSSATPAFAKKEKKPCMTCHEKGKKPTKDAPVLTDVGKYYHEKKTLEGAPAAK